MKTIEQKNRMIAEFIGFKVMKEDDFLANPRAEHLKNVMVDVAMKYHTSWDWLMPVVEAIYNTGLDEQTTNEIGDITHALLDVNIIAVHEAVVKFIEMYNKQK